MKTKIIVIKKKIDCVMPLAQCSDNIIEKLKPLGLKLRADKETDMVNGYVSIVHAKEHVITIGIYEENEDPNQEHLSTFKKPSKIPLEKEFLNLVV